MGTCGTITQVKKPENPWKFMIEARAANLYIQRCGFDCGSSFFRFRLNGYSRPRFVTDCLVPREGLKNESGDFETWGDGCKKEWWFQVRQKQCVLSKLCSSKSLELHQYMVSNRSTYVPYEQEHLRRRVTLVQFKDMLCCVSLYKVIIRNSAEPILNCLVAEGRHNLGNVNFPIVQSNNERSNGH